MNHKNKIHANSGLGIVEVLIALSVLGVVAVGVSSILKNVLSSQNTSKLKLDADNFTEELRSQLSSNQVCYNSFSNFPLTAGSQNDVTAIKNSQATPSSATDLYKLSTAYGDNSFQINSMKFTYLSDDPSDPGSGTAELAMSYISLAQAAGGGTLKDRKVLIRTKKDAANKMLECIAAAKMTDGLWHSNPASTNDIYFTGGKVGVGTNSMDQMLTIAGGIYAKSVGFVFPDGQTMASVPPICTGDNFLQWTGSTWDCQPKINYVFQMAVVGSAGGGCGGGGNCGLQNTQTERGGESGPTSSSSSE